MRTAPQKINPFIIPILLFIVCIVTHFDILNHSFMLDDSYFLNEKETLKLYPHLIDFFIKNKSTHYAPFNFILNVSLFHIFKQPFPFYLLNLMLFYINGLLLFIFINLISKNSTTALLTSILFCIHPMSGEILQHITFNDILLQMAFIELGLIALYKYATKKEHPVFYYLASLVTMFCSLLCYENSLLFPLYAAALLFFLTDTSFLKIIKTIAPYIFLNLLLIALWLITATHTIHLMQCIQSFHLTFWSWDANFFRLIAWYIKNLFVPQNILFEYMLTPVTHLTFLWDLISWCILSGYILLITCYFKRSIESFALIIFLIGFLYAVPACMSHQEIGLVFEPHWLYFSSIGFYLFTALILVRLKKHTHRLLYIAFLTTILMSLFIYTEKLHVTARNELSYCENWLRKSPHNIYTMSLLAKHYCFDKDTAIPSDLIPSMLSSVDFLINNNYYISAPKLINKLSSYQLSPSQQRELLFKSAVFYCKYGSNNECVQISNKIILSANDPHIYLQLSYYFWGFGIENRAIALLDQCISLYPKYKESYLLEGVILANHGSYDKSIALWKQGLSIDPTDIRFLTNIQKAKKYE